MKIAFVHYTIGEKDGVNSVIHSNIESLLKQFSRLRITLVGVIKKKPIRSKRVDYIDFPELDISPLKKELFSKEDVFDYMRSGERIYQKLDSLLNNYNVVIIENPNLGIHPAATYGFYRFAKKNEQSLKKRKVLFRIHDFAEDRRGNFTDILKFEGRESSPYWHKIIFPLRRNLSYIVINSTDIRKLKGHGLFEEAKVFYIPNPVDMDIKYDDINTSMKLRKLLIRKERMNKDALIIYYPVRIVPRKNVEEAIFLTIYFQYFFKRQFHLLLSLKTDLPEGIEYASKIEDFVKKHKLPVTVGLNNYVALKRIHKKGNLVKYGVGDVYNICDKVITTSLLEGFGMFFIESWFFDKAILGRDLPLITPDFKAKGINLEHLYYTLFINNKDYKSYDQKEKFGFILKLRDKKFREDFHNENRHSVHGILRFFDPDYEKSIIENNKKQVIKNFSSEAIARKIMKAINLTH